MQKVGTRGMNQIKEMNYIDELIFSGINEIIELVIVMHKKKIYLSHDIITR